MPAVQEITEPLIRENMSRAVSNVFKTMLGRLPEISLAKEQDPKLFWPPVSDARACAKPYVISTVGFIGDANGLIYLYLPLPFAKLCTRSLLGMTEREVDEAGDEVLNDAIGELTNVMIGSFKCGLCDAGYPCMLTMPSILRGTNSCIEPVSSLPRNIYAFECAGHRIVIDILMKFGGE